MSNIGTALTLKDTSVSQPTLQTVRNTQTSENRSKLLSRAKHDLLAPVRVLRHLPDWIEDDLSEVSSLIPEVVFESLGTIRAQSVRLERMLQDFMKFERLPFHQLGRDEICAETRLTELVETILPEGPWSVEILGSLPVIRADSALFDEIFSALLSNAVKHSTQNRGFIRIRLVQGPSHFDIEISDEGNGISDENLISVFEPFIMLQSRDEIEGSGMGLAIALRAVNLLGGEIQVGRGTDENGFAVAARFPSELLVEKE